MSRAEIFATTHPSLIGRLFDEQPAARESAWSAFIQRYEEPITLCLRALLRRAPHWAPPARDLTASFFGSLLLGGVLGKWDARRGPLRAYVQGVLRRFLASALRDHAPVARRAECDPDELLTADDVVAADFERRWAYQVFVLALGNLARGHRELAETWIDIEGLDLLVADRERWVLRSFDEAMAAIGHATAGHDAEALAQLQGVAVGTVHNRKYRANTLLLGYVAAEIRRFESADETEAMDRFFELLMPLIPRLSVLRQRTTERRDASGPSSSKPG